MLRPGMGELHYAASGRAKAMPAPGSCQARLTTSVICNRDPARGSVIATGPAAKSWSATVLYKIAHALKSMIASLYWLATMGRWGVQGVFDTLYTGQMRSETFRNMYRDVFGADYAEEADPTGYLTMTDLANIARHIHVTSGQSFVDLACGRGGASLWVARATGGVATGNRHLARGGRRRAAAHILLRHGRQSEVRSARYHGHRLPGSQFRRRDERRRLVPGAR